MRREIVGLCCIASTSIFMTFAFKARLYKAVELNFTTLRIQNFKQNNFRSFNTLRYGEN